MDNMFDLLAEESTLKDDPDAKALVVSRGEVRFNNVKFSYGDERIVVNCLNFTINPGETVALVGATVIHTLIHT